MGPTLVERHEPVALLKLLAHPTNQSILSALAVEPAYARRLATLLSIGETEITRRLRAMEKQGLVAGEWVHIGKNVKQYRLVVRNIEVAIGAEGVHTQSGNQGPAKVAPVVQHIPTADGLVGRDHELRELQECAVAVIQGMPGMGKTVLAAAHVSRNSADHHVFWHAFQGVESLAWLAHRASAVLAGQGDLSLKEALAAEPDPTTIRELLVAAWNQPGRMTVLEDVHRIDDPLTRDLLTQAINRIRDGRLVVTSRARPSYAPSPDVRHCRLEGLDNDAMLALLRRAGVDVPRSLLARVRDELGGHPLAANLFAQTILEEGCEVESLLDRIPERDLELYLLDEIQGHLSDGERAVLHAASIFRVPFGVNELRAVTDKDPSAPLVQLRRRMLVQEADGEFSLHEVIRNFFRSRIEDAAHLHRAAARHYQGRGDPDGRILAMHHWLRAGRKGDVVRLVQMDLDVEDVKALRGSMRSLYLETLRAIEDDRSIKDADRAILHDEVGDILLYREQWAEALAEYDAATALLGRAGRAAREADLAWKCGQCLQALGRGEEALDRCRQALAGAQGLNKQRLEAMIAGLS